jgi:hypothetical protein
MFLLIPEPWLAGRGSGAGKKARLETIQQAFSRATWSFKYCVSSAYADADSAADWTRRTCRPAA